MNNTVVPIPRGNGEISSQ